MPRLLVLTIPRGSTMEPSPTEFRPQLNEEQWALLTDLFLSLCLICEAVAPGRKYVAASKAFGAKESVLLSCQ